MNYLQKYALRKQLLNNLTLDCKVNWIKLRSNTTKEHFLKQLEIAYDLVKAGHEVVVEAKFKTGGRADILDITNFTVIEVLHSETLAEAKKKVKKYPDFLEIRYVKT